MALLTGLTGVPYDVSVHYGNYGSSNVIPRGKHILDRRDLYFKDGTSDKIYIVVTSQSVQGGSDYFVDAFYGRRGGNMTHQPKAAVVSVSGAQAVASKLIIEKKNKGYVDYIQGTPNTVKGQQAQSANLKPSSAFPPTNLKWPEYYQSTPAGKTAPSQIIEDTLYILEDVLDGPRVYVNVYDSLQSNPTILAMDLNGNTTDVGISLAHIMTFLRSFSSNKNFVLDGHLMHEDPARCNPHEIFKVIMQGTVADREKLYIKVIDLPFYGSNDLTNLEWKDRRAMMTGLFNDVKKALKSPSWNVYNDFITYPIVMHKYAFQKKEEFVAGKAEMIGKHLRGKYLIPTGVLGADIKDKWYKWKVGSKNGK